MKKVAVVRYEYLPISETFIYNELVNLKQFFPFVFTKVTKNLDKFPFEPIMIFTDKIELENKIISNDIGLLHARFGVTGVKLLNVKKKLNIPMVTSFHGFDLPSNQKTYAKYGDKMQDLFKEGELFTTTSYTMKKILMDYGCPEKKIIVHYSGVDIERFKYKERKVDDKHAITILSVGRLVEKKGMEYLIKAFSKVSEGHSNVELRIAGEGSLRNHLYQIVQELKLEDKVHFLGAISHNDVAKEMENAHYFVLASMTANNGNQEGIPNVLKEAMACGLPIISTRHAGIPELVEHGKSGFLAQERNSAELADYMIEMIENPNDWNEFGRRGREKVETSFNLKKQITRLEAIYSRIIREHKEMHQK